MTTDPIGIYVHIPFCKSKCNYCDFCSYPSLYEARADEYVERVITEADGYRKEHPLRVDTVYFGGGTPSLLTPSQLERLLKALREVFDILPDAEITLEANPGTLTEEKAKGYKALGINRISLGVQTIHEKELKSLGRIHTYGDFLTSYKLLRECGFDNISVDLMYGIPHQTTDSFAETLREIILLKPEHISAYGLIIEEGTPFYGMADTLPLPTEDEECEMYYTASRILKDAGYSHYEISNYATPSRESRHNLKYWHDEQYIGLGAAAYSYFGGSRHGNPRSFDEYMSGAPVEDIDTPDRDGEMFEYAMMHLRLAEGIDLAGYEARFGASFAEGKEDTIEKYKRAGMLTCDEERIALTEQGFYISNSILSELL